MVEIAIGNVYKISHFVRLVRSEGRGGLAILYRWIWKEMGKHRWCNCTTRTAFEATLRHYEKIWENTREIVRRWANIHVRDMIWVTG